HPRRHLVGQQLPVAAEQLQCEHAHVVQRLGQATGMADRTRLQLGVQARGREAGGEDAVDVPVAGRGPGAEIAVTAAHGHHRQLEVEGDEALQDQPGAVDLGAEGVPRRLDRACTHLRAKAELALAVVAQPAGLEDRRQADFVRRPRQRVPAVDVGERRHRNPQFAEQALLAEPVLRGGKRAWPRVHLHVRAQPVTGTGRNVLEVEGRHVDAAGEFLPRGAGVVAAGHPRDDLARTRLARRIQRHHRHPERGRGQRHHPGQLPAPEDAQPLHARGSIRGSSLAATSAVWRARNASRARATSGWSTASRDAANRAASAAPASPMAKVATGTPAGICTMDSSESSPLSARLLTGTPSTGTVVLDAIMPGRWAAPPAPAMIARRPRPAASPAYSNSASGVRCAETTRTSCAIPSASRRVLACCIVSQSDREPITTPTSGARAVSVMAGACGKTVFYRSSAGAEDPMDRKLIDLLACPATRQPLSLLDARGLNALNEA